MKKALLRVAALYVAAAMLAGCSSNPEAAATSINAAKQHHTFVIVHGAWGGGWAFREVDRLMTADGNKVYRPTLTGQGEKAHLASPNVGLETHIMDVVNVIRFEDLHDVVLVGHSYGGMVVTGVADRVPDRIAKLVYVDAVLPEDGESLNTAFKDAGGREGLPMKLEERDGFILPTWVKPGAPYPHDVPQSAKTFSDPEHLEHVAALRKIPTVYILTVEKGKPAAKDDFYPFYRRAQERGIPTWIMAGDHNVQWSHPKELVRLLEKAAE
ncbi:MAG: alpha/beta fold hydrolase [Phycisphaerae bacterium]